jgi:hypothetical protein
MNGQGAEVRPAQASVDLAPHVERNFLTFDETDPTAEERHDVGAEAETEVEIVGALEEESPFLGKEEGESGQVRLSRVDFRLGEIGVERPGSEKIRTESLLHVEAGLSLDDRL